MTSTTSCAEIAPQAHQEPVLWLLVALPYTERAKQVAEGGQLVLTSSAGSQRALAWEELPESVGKHASAASTSVPTDYEGRHGK